jgi:hypothetical protein
MIITLSSYEAEYVALSESLRDTIPLMNLINEFKQHGFEVITKQGTKGLLQSFQRQLWSTQTGSSTKDVTLH